MQEIEIVDKMLERLFGESFIMASELHAWQKIKELAQQTTNKPITPCQECAQPERVESMRRWRWKFCPDCGREIPATA